MLAKEQSTYLVPGEVRFRPLKTSEVSSPPTTAKGDTETSMGDRRALQDLHRRISPEDSLLGSGKF